MLTWGATPEEATCRYPGDELVPDPDGGATMATVLPAPPEGVWPWLVQIGDDRGGWYSLDWLDNSGKPSADLWVPITLSQPLTWCLLAGRGRSS